MSCRRGSWPRSGHVCAALPYVLLVACTVPVAPTRADPPNILFVYVDDMGWNDLGCYGNRYHETPELDELCRSGMKFTNAYAAAPVCAPSRASLMTGRDVVGHGIYCVNEPDRSHAAARQFDSPPNNSRLPLEMVTIAELLAGAGYRTGCYGKWHLGHDGRQVSPWHPLRRGFDEAIQTRSPSGSRRYFYPDFSTIPEVPIAAGTHLSDFVTDQAIGFLERNAMRRFFLFLPYFSVHGPRQAKPAALARFASKDPSSDSDDPVFAAMHEDLDTCVGRLLDKLQELGLARNTLVVFASDNGANSRYDNSPLRRGKGWLYEGGIRVPMFVRWPGRIVPESRCHAPVTAVDLFPTLCAIAGAQPPADQPCDGVDLTPLFDGAGTAELPQRPLLWHYPVYGQYREGRFRRTPMSAIRRGSFKLVYHYEGDFAQLFDLDEDPGEQTDLAGQQPALAASLKEQLLAWVAENPAMVPRRSAR